MHRSFFFFLTPKCMFLNISFYFGDCVEVWTKSRTHYPTQPFCPYHKRQVAHRLKQQWRDELVEPHVTLQHKRRPRGSRARRRGRPQPSEPFQGGFQKKEEGHAPSWEDWDQPPPSLCTLGPHHFRVVFNDLPRSGNCYTIPDWWDGRDRTKSWLLPFSFSFNLPFPYLGLANVHP